MPSADFPGGGVGFGRFAAPLSIASRRRCRPCSMPTATSGDPAVAGAALPSSYGIYLATVEPGRAPVNAVLAGAKLFRLLSGLLSGSRGAFENKWGGRDSEWISLCSFLLSVFF